MPTHQLQLCWSFLFWRAPQEPCSAKFQYQFKGWRHRPLRWCRNLPLSHKGPPYQQPKCSIVLNPCGWCFNDDSMTLLLVSARISSWFLPKWIFLWFSVNWAVLHRAGTPWRQQAAYWRVCSNWWFWRCWGAWVLSGSPLLWRPCRCLWLPLSEPTITDLLELDKLDCCQLWCYAAPRQPHPTEPALSQLF